MHEAALAVREACGDAAFFAAADALFERQTEVFDANVEDLTIRQIRGLVSAIVKGVPAVGDAFVPSSCELKPADDSVRPDGAGAATPGLPPAPQSD